MTRFLLLCVALATVPSASALAPGEFPIAPLPSGFAPHDRQNVEVAANDVLAFAAWEDGRVDPAQPRIWGQRVRVSTGEILDPTGISIVKLATTPRSRLLAVGTDGTDFLIAWTDGDRMKLAKVTRGGAVVPLPDPNPNISVEQASINWAGDSYAVFFTDPAPPAFFPPAINVILFRTDGTTRAPAAVVLRSEGVASFASASSNGGELLFVSWSDVADGAVHALSFGTFLLRDSTLVAAPPVVPVFQPGQPPLNVSMATNGVDAFAAWFEQDNQDYRARRFSGNGAPFGSPAIVAPAPDEEADTALTWDGVQYVLFFKAEDDSLQAVRYAADGSRLDVTPLGLAPAVVEDVSATAPLSLPDGSFVAWISHDDTGAQVFGDFLTRTGVFGPPPGEQTLSVSFADRSDASVVWVGDHYLAAWHDATNFTRAAIGRFTIEGQPLDGTGIIISSGDVAAPPVLATNGRTAVVAWRDTNGVAAALVDGGSVFQLFEDFAGGLPSVNWNGQQYLIAWRSPQEQLLGIRVSGSGTFIDQQPVTIAPVTGQPVIGWTGNSYVVAFRDPEGCFLPCNPAMLWAQLVSPFLTAIGSRIQLSETLAGLPAIAGGPAGALVVWPRTVGTTTTLRGARVVNGAVLDPLNGFEIGAATHATVYAGAKGWGVVSGPFHWSVSANGTVTPRSTLFPFVPAGARSSVVLGGPEPLVVYRREPGGSEQMMQSVARFFISKTRDRAVRH